MYERLVVAHISWGMGGIVDTFQDSLLGPAKRLPVSWL